MSRRKRHGRRKKSRASRSSSGNTRLTVDRGRRSGHYQGANYSEVYKNGKVWKWKNLQKWSRTYSRAGVWRLNPNTYDRTVRVKVNTNGRCIVGVGVK